ncbi:MAG: hypothetical protein LBC18_14055, partial [Opitutaceae bacterium]|nr:hypothetical protein [Opitutaceae bacterium]
MTVFLAFVKKELLALARDVPGLLVLFLMPAAFVLVMSLAMRDALKPDAGGWCRWRAWDLDASAESAAFLAALPAEARVAAAEAPATPAAGPAGRERTAADDAPAAAAERERVARAELTAALGGGEIEAGVLVRRGFGGAVADAGRAGVFVEVVAEPGVPGARVAAFHAEAARAVALARMGLALGGGWPRDAAGNRLSVGQVSGAALVEAR